jgi:hypothetical protein
VENAPVPVSRRTIKLLSLTNQAANGERRPFHRRQMLDTTGGTRCPPADQEISSEGIAEMGNSVSVTMPDTSVFGAIMRGNAQVAQELEQLRAGGEKIVVPWAVYHELQNTPNSVTRSVQLTLIQELGLTVQDPTSLKQRLDVYAGAEKPNARAPAGYINLKVSGVGQSDLAVIADVWIYQESVHGKTRSVRLWTVERMAQNNDIQRQYNITFSPLSRRLPAGPFVSAEEVFALFPSLKGKYRVTVDGRLVRNFWSGKIGTGVKVGGMVVGGLLLRGLLGIFAAKVYAHYAQQALDRQFETIRAQIADDIGHWRNKEDALYLIAFGRQAFAVTVLKIWTNTDFVGGQGTSMPVVEYLGMTISDTKKENHTFKRDQYFGNYNDIDTYTTSSPMTFDKNFVELYKEYINEVAHLQDRIETTTSFREAGQLKAELMDMVSKMRMFLSQTP